MSETGALVSALDTAASAQLPPARAAAPLADAAAAVVEPADTSTGAVRSALHSIVSCRL